MSSHSGLGLETNRELARAGASVVLAVRSPEKGKAAVEAVAHDVPGADLHVQELDLGSLASVREAAAALSSSWDQTAAAGSRIVTVSSNGHRMRSAIDLDTINDDATYDRTAAYGRSKLANLLFTYALQRGLTAAGSTTIALAAHPGVSDSELGRHLPRAVMPLMPVFNRLVQSAAAGAEPQLRAATDPAATGGSYYGPSGPARRSCPRCEPKAAGPS